MTKDDKDVRQVIDTRLVQDRNERASKDAERLNEVLRMPATRGDLFYLAQLVSTNRDLRKALIDRWTR